MEATCNHERQIQIVVSVLFIKSKQKMLMKRSRVKGLKEPWDICQSSKESGLYHGKKEKVIGEFQDESRDSSPDECDRIIRWYQK